jgi:hypothetical protein
MRSSALHGHRLDAAALAHGQHTAVPTGCGVLPAVRLGACHLHVELVGGTRLLALGRLRTNPSLPVSKKEKETHA